MWPWEHLAVGYLCYSLAARGLGRDPPTDVEVAVLAVATQLPDLVDKPLSWEFGVFPTGHAVAHSALVAVPVGAAVLAVARRRGRLRTGIAFEVGHWSHLAADVLDPLRAGGTPVVSRVLWPVVKGAGYGTDYGLARGVVYIERFLSGLATADPAGVFLLYLLIPLATFGVWLADGAPGTGLLGRAARGIRRRAG